MASNPEQDFVLKTIKSRDVHFVRFWFTDVLGSMKSFAVIPSELEDAFADGMGFDGSCIEGFCRTEESDMLAFPDASTFQVRPWRPSRTATCSPSRAKSCAVKGSARFPKAWARPSSCSGARSSCAKRWAITSAITWWKPSRPSGTSTSPTCQPGSLTATWRFCNGARDDT